MSSFFLSAIAITLQKRRKSTKVRSPRGAKAQVLQPTKTPHFFFGSVSLKFLISCQFCYSSLDFSAMLEPSSSEEDEDELAGGGQTPARRPGGGGSGGHQRGGGGQSNGDIGGGVSKAGGGGLGGGGLTAGKTSLDVPSAGSQQR